MAVTYTNNWKNILTALMSKIRAEMKCPVYSDWDSEIKGNQLIRVIPICSAQGDVTKFSEQRNFNIEFKQERFTISELCFKSSKYIRSIDTR